MSSAFNSQNPRSPRLRDETLDEGLDISSEGEVDGPASASASQRSTKKNKVGSRWLLRSMRSVGGKGSVVAAQPLRCVRPEAIEWKASSVPSELEAGDLDYNKDCIRTSRGASFGCN